MNKKINTRRLVESGILIALALILSKIKIINLPWGGGISLFGMMPMILLSYRHGLKWGLFSSFVYGAVKITFAFVDNSFAALSFGSLALMLVIDYVLAYTCMGLAGLFSNKKPTVGLTLGTIVAVVSRYIFHMISGAIFFGEYAEWFFGDTEFPRVMGESILNTFSGVGLSTIYSVVYNGIFMVGELILTLVAAIIISKIPVITKKIEQ